MWVRETGSFPTPLVDSSESDYGFQHGEPSTYPPPLESSSDSDEQPEDDALRILSVALHPRALVENTTTGLEGSVLPTYRYDTNEDALMQRLYIGRRISTALTKSR